MCNHSQPGVGVILLTRAVKNKAYGAHAHHQKKVYHFDGYLLHLNSRRSKKNQISVRTFGKVENSFSKILKISFVFFPDFKVSQKSVHLKSAHVGHILD